MSSSKVPVSFLNGFSPRNGVIGVLGFPHGLDKRAEFTRFFTYIDGNWGASDLEYQGKSLTSLTDASRGYRAWWLLGKNGETTELTASGKVDEQIPGAGLNVAEPYGYVEVIRNIAGQLYVCGYGRQVYKRVGDDWISIATDILTRETAKGFMDIAGISEDQVYAVGWGGEIYFHDGRRWHKDDSPTTAHLTGVRCLENGQVVVCGHKGVVLRGAFNLWEVVDDNGLNGNWYDIEVYGDTIYLAGNNQLAKVENDKIVPIDIGIGRSVSTHKLHVKDGLLWSFGEDDIVVFDGQKWQEIIHPDNA
ncbi:hypothetical protein ACWKWZ_18085 [Metapseudomonas otitidis]|jgi:hypothetical protein|uniref:Uncharacterized protein n=1 Tax=Metapseudomonas otitidis TaxID=319939 RepID=A0A1I0UHA2_9GAMM|nr:MULTISPECIES: hypothetical protein [Pseudomonas]MDL5594090.1 hypothetical protein [Bacillus subtilis]MBO2927693.1 hypothetical protein [Pseudomonas otitidis]MDG9779803.1 hypothetical protein [Pseudomonas otitidis]MDH0339588.1 hypothetical protein [Pseudomonas otitidis]MDI6525004.1 hypothetical protein [Pseudomonas otitidis]